MPGLGTGTVKTMPDETHWRQRGPLMRFFAEHRRCGHGFDLGHPGGSGSGNLRARCRGCGAEIAYLAGDEEPHETVPDVAPERGPGKSAERLSRTRAEDVAQRRSSWRSTVATAAIALVVLAFATFVVAHLGGDSAMEKPSGGEQTGVTTATLPAPTGAEPIVGAPLPPPSAAQEAGNPGGSATSPGIGNGNGKDKGSRSNGNAHGAPGVRQSLAEGGPSISVPEHWDVVYADGAFTVSPDGSSSAAVRVYFERGAPMDPDTLRDRTRAMLEKEHPGATLTTEGPLISGSDGTSAVATWDGGFERAQAVSEDGLTIFVLARADNTAEPQWQSEVLEIAASVRA